MDATVSSQSNSIVVFSSNLASGAPSVISYLLLETGDKIILEDGTGFLLLETSS